MVNNVKCPKCNSDLKKILDDLSDVLICPKCHWDVQIPKVEA